MSTILIFDDRPEEQDEIIKGLNRKCGKAVEIIAFNDEIDLKEKLSFELHILSWVERVMKDKDVGLVVCDKELGRYRKCKGLSATAVSVVAERKGFPFCVYSRAATEDDRELARFKGLRRWESGEITLDGLGAADWVRQIVDLFQGFEQIKTNYADVAGECKTPAAALATILSHPDSESRIAMYGSGEQTFLKEILPYYDSEKPNIKELQQRMPRILGTWLYLSILRFPGILVNQTAAASYLNISCDDFKKPEVQAYFEKSRYTGPFGELGPWWWRNELDSIIDEADCKDGREYVGKQGVDTSVCDDPDSKERAGYYCMLTQTPVSDDNSCGGISWFPSGSDLARIRKDKFEEITAMVGMY